MLLGATVPSAIFKISKPKKTLCYFHDYLFEAWASHQCVLLCRFINNKLYYKSNSVRVDANGSDGNKIMVGSSAMMNQN